MNPQSTSIRISFQGAQESNKGSTGHDCTFISQTRDHQETWLSDDEHFLAVRYVGLQGRQLEDGFPVEGRKLDKSPRFHSKITSGPSGCTNNIENQSFRDAKLTDRLIDTGVSDVCCDVFPDTYTQQNGPKRRSSFNPKPLSIAFRRSTLTTLDGGQIGGTTGKSGCPTRAKTESGLTIFGQRGVSKNSLMLKKKKRISLQAFFTHSQPSLVVVSNGIQAGTMKDASEAYDLCGIPTVSTGPSTSISVVGRLGDNVASDTTLFGTKVPSRSSPPPSFLLDEDPFANLTSVKVGTARKGGRSNSRSSVASASGIIPHNQRPPPLYSEVVPTLFAPLPISPVPKSHLQEAVELDSATGKVRRAKSQDANKEPDKLKRKRAKTFFATVSAPVSPSKALFSSSKIKALEPTSPPTSPVPPVPPLSTTALNLLSSMSLPSSPRPSAKSIRGPFPPPPSPGRIQPRPAHQRPAFAPKPSLPSLNTLAKMNVVLTKKVRKGHVGAGLPFEPWDNLPSDDECSSSTVSASTPLTSSTTPQVNLDDLPCQSAPAFDRPHSISVPTSPTPSARSSSTVSSPSSSALSLATPPQPLLPSQIVALGSFVEDLDMDLSRPPSPLKPDVSILPSLPLSSKLKTIPVGLDATAVASPLLPTVPEDLEISASKAEPESTEETQTTPRANGPSVHEDSSYFNGDLLDDYGISLPPEIELSDYQHYLATASAELDDRQNGIQFRRESGNSSLIDEENSILKQDEGAADARPQSRTGFHPDTDPDLYAESFSDLFIMPSRSYNHTYSSSDMDSTTDVSHDFSLSRSISSTSFSSSFDDEVRSATRNFRRFRGRACNASQSSQSTDGSLGTYEQGQHSVSKSGDNSLLHSPDTEWISFTSQQAHHPPQGELLASRLNEGGFTIQSDFAVVEHQTQPQPHANQMPAASVLQVYEPHNEGGRDIDDHAVISNNCLPPIGTCWDANGINRPATADDLFLTPTATIGSGSISAPVLLHDQGELSEEASVPSAVSNDHITSSSLFFDTPSSCRTSAISRSPPLQSSSEQLQDERQDMIGLSARQKVGYVAGVDVSSPYRDYDLPSLPSRDVKRNISTRTAGSIPQQRTDIPSPLASRSQSRSVSRSTSASASRFPALKRPFPPSTFASSSSTSEEEEEEDSTSSDDDIPLAQRIPSALTAQQVIRQKVKEERKVEREKRHRERQITLRPARGLTLGDVTGVQEVIPAPATYPASKNTGPTVDNSPISRPKQRPRTNTMPSQPSAAPEFGQAFNAEDLARKLQTVKMMAEGPSSLVSPIHIRQPLSAQLSHASSLRRSESSSKHRYDHELSAQYTMGALPSTSAPPVGTLKSNRSIHVVDELRTRTMDQKSLHKRSMSMSRDKERSWRVQEEFVPPLPSSNLHGRASLDDYRDHGRRVIKTQADPRITSTTSPEVERHRERGTQPSTNTAVAVNTLGPTTKQRIFIHSQQHQHIVDIGPTTSAGDVIASCEATGTLDGWAGLGGWMIWEIAQDFGMERPVRSYELLSDVQGSWRKEKTINYFLLKKTLLSEPLGRSAIPSSAPTHSGWVEWESKRGKWSKRWMHLKENTIYLSKKDGRDETLLCSLSNFDAYFITRSHRSPKPFAFTIKSTDSLSFFENTDDYMHTFSCSEKDGEAWVKKILIARSYVLHQERTALFNPQTPITSGVGASITRSSTRRTTASKPIQPLVNLPTGDIFEPGSLLSKQQATSQQP